METKEAEAKFTQNVLTEETPAQEEFAAYEELGMLCYVPVGWLTDFPEQMGREVRIGGYDIALFHTTEGKLFALENRTPHSKGGPLVEGIVSGEYIYCPLRDLKIRLADGVVQEPDDGQVQTYPVLVDEQGRVELGIPL